MGSPEWMLVKAVEKDMVGLLKDMARQSSMENKISCS